MLIKLSQRNYELLKNSITHVLQNMQIQHTFLHEIHVNPGLAESDLLNRIVTCNEQALHFTKELNATLLNV